MVPRRVYHASSVQGLGTLIPSDSTHGSWIYAVGDPELAACFLSTTGGDLTCAVGRDRLSGKAYVCGRFKGAFDHRYAGRSGSIYTLEGSDFHAGRTPWSEEFVCAKPVPSIDEVRIEDASAHLRHLNTIGMIELVRYPERIDGIPADDSDLVLRATEWYRKMGATALDGFASYHPRLLSEIRRHLDL